MFVDEVDFKVKAGDGGNGVIAFRREKFIPRGGPAGGDGGRGGSVVLLADQRLTTLIDFRYKRNYKAPRGADGANNNMTGLSGQDLVLSVPVGTQVFDTDTGDLIADLMEDGQKFIVAKGGRGGRGNAKFATATHQTPRTAENGEPGEEMNISLELKLLADVGLLGFPNVGKSTLIASVSAARPKIANYPFTTLVPNLGVVKVDETTSFVMADIPGLIEGAHEGTGLGDRFLRHVERTRLLLHIIDCSGTTGRNPAEDFDVINRELHLYSPRLAEVPQVVALNKIDVPGGKETAETLLPEFEKRGLKTFAISAATGEGVKPLIYFLSQELQKLDRTVLGPVEMEEVIRIAPEGLSPRNFQVKKVDEHQYEVEGKGLIRMIAMMNLETDESIRRLHRKLDRLGVLQSLRDAGVEHGDSVRVGSIEFDYADDNKVE
jgi:GTP-binding protein